MMLVSVVSLLFYYHLIQSNQVQGFIIPISFSCVTRAGSSVVGYGLTSSASCDSDEVLVSCGVKGSHNIGGTWIDPSSPDTCQVLSHTSLYGIVAEARCCSFGTGVVESVSTVVSDVALQYDIVYCPSGSVLTGCQVYVESGTVNNIIGTYSGASIQGTWVTTNNQCYAGAKTSATLVKANAQCITFASDFTLTCQTKAAYTNYANFGSCDSGYSMTSCNTITFTADGLDSWYINTDDKCYVQQDGHAYQYANAICCQLEQDGLEYKTMDCETDTAYINAWDGYHNNLDHDTLGSGEYFLAGQYSVHDSVKEDRRFKWTYCRPLNQMNLWDGSYFALSPTSYDSEWTRTCSETNSAMVGAISTHDSHYEDRVWTFYCRTLASPRKLTDCVLSGQLNAYDGVLDYDCPNNGVVRSIWSHHDSGKEDRIWKFECCRVAAPETLAPTVFPTSSPTKSPTEDPTKGPTDKPTKGPTENPTKGPTKDPSKEPTRGPTKGPTKDPTLGPTNGPTKGPTRVPSTDPTEYPTTVNPTGLPTGGPTVKPTRGPTSGPTVKPTSGPSSGPTGDPTEGPTNDPTRGPSDGPTKSPSDHPTKGPTAGPTNWPTVGPTDHPTAKPTNDPTAMPSDNPTARPTDVPTNGPTTRPSNNPTTRPSGHPTEDPTTGGPTDAPTDGPTAGPSVVSTLNNSSGLLSVFPDKMSIYITIIIFFLCVTLVVIICIKKHLFSGSDNDPFGKKQKVLRVQQNSVVTKDEGTEGTRGDTLP